MRQEQVDNLRKGYTTGACATAGAVVGWQLLNGSVSPESVLLLLPNEQKLTIPLAKIEQTTTEVVAEIVKDAGDDPDVTDKMTIRVRTKRASEAEINAEDYLESCGNGFIIVKGGVGVGLVTRPGLDATVGKWAINSSPRKILVNNLKNAGFGAECSYLSVEITAVNGRTLAKKTLNPMLGVIDGISILGTTGIVVPYSNAAYIKTIEIRVRCAVEEGAEELAFTTGSRTKNAILRDCPKINESTCIRIGDFIADSLKAVAATELKTVNVACMPGKLYKYACGYEYTHAHKVRLNPDLMVKELKLLDVEQMVLDKIKKCDTVGEAASMLEHDIYRLLLDNLAAKALGYLSQWAGKVKVKLYVYDLAGKQLLER
jgi:cobalt-precorrin-5B (C1)-methyltransferase